VDPEHGEAGPDSARHEEHGQGQGQVGPDGEGWVSLEDEGEAGTENDLRPEAVDLGHTEPDGRGGQQVQASGSWGHAHPVVETILSSVRLSVHPSCTCYAHRF
jgi:hypothetical protein